MLNQFTLIGRMAKTPQLQTTREGVPYIRFTLAVRRTFKNQSGTYDTDFIQLVSWNKLAETVADYCTKGSLISVNGRIQMRSIETDNQKRLTVPDVIAETVTFLQLKRLENKDQSIHIPPKPATSQEHSSHTNSQKATQQSITLTPETPPSSVDPTQEQQTQSPNSPTSSL